MSQDWGPYLRGLRMRASARGLCKECRAREPRPGKLKCETCANRNRDFRARRIAEGACRELCGRQAAPNRARCETCLERARIYKQRHREKQRALRERRPISPTPIANSQIARSPNRDAIGVGLSTREVG